MGQLKAGEVAPPFELLSIQGRRLKSSDHPGSNLLLCFHRYARCALCSERVLELAAALPRLQKRFELRCVFVCHSTRKRLLDEFDKMDLPFHIAADPDREMYDAYKVAKSLRRAVSSRSRVAIRTARGRRVPDGKPLGLELPLTMIPADFLVGPDGRIRLAHYGEYLGDTLSIDRVESVLDEPYADDFSTPPTPM